jgi:2-dehydrotetronate isomerase
MPNLAANISLLFPELPFLDRYEAAAKVGFKAVETLFPYEFDPAEIRSRLDRYGLTQVLINTPPGDWNAGERGIGALPGREADFEKSFDKALSYAKTLGCDKIHVMAGILPKGADRAQCRDVFVANLLKAAAKARNEGVTLLVEPLNTRDFPGYLHSTNDEAADIIVRTGHAVLLQFDLYHSQIMGGDLAERMRIFWPLVRHIQIAGVPGRHEPDVGEINYPYLFDVIDSLGYKGWIGCEYRPKAGTLEGLGWAKPYGIGGQ